MRRRVFLALLTGVALCGVGASAQTSQPGAQAPQQPQQQESPSADRVTVEEFKALLAAGRVYVLDVRYGIDRKIKGAAHVPLGDLEARLADIPRDREVVTYCS